MLKKGPKDLVELTTGTQQYLIAHKQQPRGKTTSTVHPKRAKQRKPTQSKLDTTQERQRWLQCHRCQGYGLRQSEFPTKVSRGKDEKSLTPVCQSNQKKTCAMVDKSHENGSRGFYICERRGTQITWKVPKSNSNGLTSNDGQETKTDGMKFK